MTREDVDAWLRKSLPYSYGVLGVCRLASDGIFGKPTAAPALSVFRGIDAVRCLSAWQHLRLPASSWKEVGRDKR